jgi:hypothetical protein
MVTIVQNGAQFALWVKLTWQIPKIIKKMPILQKSLWGKSMKSQKAVILSLDLAESEGFAWVL